MPTITAGDLTAAHIGATVALTIPDGLASEPLHVTGVLARVQHNGPGLDHIGAPTPAETLVATSAWSGPLDPTHPITVED